MRLQDLLARFPGAHAVGLVDGGDEDLPVSDLARPAVLEHRVDDRLDVAVGDHALQLDLRTKVFRELRAAIALGDALLAARALDLADRQRREAEREQLEADRLEG